MNNIKTWIIICLFANIYLFLVVLNNNFRKLKFEYQEQLFNKEIVIDGLQEDIEIKVQEINLLEKKIYSLEQSVDSLQNIKIEVSEKEFEISSSISESVKLLRENLKCVEL